MSNGRIPRTRRRLHEALVGLILERGFDAVSVQELCDRAGVARSTFYNHFADKEELLDGAFDDVRREMRAAPRAPGGRLPLLGGIIAYAQRERRLVQALLGRRGSPATRRRFHLHVVRVVREELRGDLPQGAEGEAVVRFLAGGFVELLGWWLEGRPPLRAEVLEAHVQAMAGRLLPRRS